MPRRPLSVERVDEARARLSAAGVPTADADVDLLLAHARASRSSFDELVEQRARRVPLSHLVGEVDFDGLAFHTGPGVFTPQPETRSLVDWVVRACAGRTGLVVVDLCTGAGTVALALAHRLAQPVVHAVERDADAVHWALRNAARRAEAGDPAVQVSLGDAATCLPELDGKVDVVVSNPPYVASHEAHIPSPEVLAHDPSLALWAGADGLDVIRLVERTAARLLKPGGTVAVEHSDRQGATAPEVFRTSGAWRDVQDHPDHEGHDRFVTATRG